MSSNLETVRLALTKTREYFMCWPDNRFDGSYLDKLTREALAALPAEPDNIILREGKMPNIVVDGEHHWQVGDTGPNGGTIVKVYKPGDKRVALECEEKDWEGEYRWDLALEVAESQGYRIPTRKQMRYIAEAVELADDWYWTREEHPEGSETWAYIFRGKEAWRCERKTAPHRVRAVRFVGEGK